MKTLAEKDDFQDFYWYITDAETFGRDWITKFTNNKIFSKSRGKNTKYSSIISKLIEEFIVVIQDCLDFATNIAVKRSKQTDTSFWTTTFEKTLGCQLPVPYHTFAFMRELSVNDCTFVHKHFKGQIKELTKKLEYTFLHKSIREVLWKGKILITPFSTHYGDVMNVVPSVEKHVRKQAKITLTNHTHACNIDPQA
ncbi:unnamed protein product [Mytilus coruscus]|nr:unnamed protein product [Mytilus coruscus]